MYSVMAADDDVNILAEIKNLFAGLAPEFQLVATAGNGRETLSKMSRLHPDILLLDIEMPEMSGLEALLEMKKSRMRCKVIVLSCHDDYANVRAAMKEGASEYLLKQDLNEEKLVSVLRKAADEMAAERSREEKLDNLETFAGIVAPSIKADLVFDLVKGYVTGKSLIKKRLWMANADLPLDNLVVCCIKIDGYCEVLRRLSDWSEEMFVFAVENIIGEITENCGHAIYGKTGGETHFILFGYPDGKDYFAINNDVYRVLSLIQRSLWDTLKIRVTCGVSNVFSNTEKTAEFAGQASSAAETDFYLGKGRMIQYAEARKFCERLKPEKKKEYIGRITSVPCQSGKSAREIRDSVAAVYGELERDRVCIEDVKRLNLRLISSLEKQLRDLGIDDAVLGEQGFPYERVNDIGDREDLADWLAAFLLKISDAVQKGNKTESRRSEVAKAEEYIKANFQHPLSLEKIASQVHLNKSYLSYVFKKETGENFVDYLNRVRIEKSKGLLESTGNKIYDVALSVGFDNYRYFTRVFKELTGMKPLEYRRKHQAEPA